MHVIKHVLEAAALIDFGAGVLIGAAITKTAGGIRRRHRARKAAA